VNVTRRGMFKGKNHQKVSRGIKKVSLERPNLSAKLGQKEAE